MALTFTASGDTCAHIGFNVVYSKQRFAEVGEVRSTLQRLRTT
ncbi:MAG: hypothetical protein ACOY7P_12300 [Pseudomonadota bacterium]